MKETLYVVGIGASAGGLEALLELLPHVPRELSANFCFVVAQHLSPKHKSMLAKILSRVSLLEVVEAQRNMALEAGKVYVTPPDSDIWIENGSIKLAKASFRQMPQPSVDMLFESIAQHYAKYAVGIVLSGTGSDGARGAYAIKQKGGVVMVQSPESAKYSGMPLSVLQTTAVDFILPPKSIAHKLADLQNNTLLSQEASLSVEAYIRLKKLLDLLQKTYGINFNLYKSQILMRKLQKAAEQLKYTHWVDYVDYALTNSNELDKLYQNFLINVTEFFRDREAFEALAEVVEELITHNFEQKTFRVWVAGCSTGEEAYSIAMLVQNLLDKHQKHECVLQVLATDINEKVLQLARKGEYKFSQMQHVPPELLQKYCLLQEHGYIINKELRSKIFFSKHDITQDAPFLRIDLLSCRNLLIYLNAEMQYKILSIFHYALQPRGILFLGKSEGTHYVEYLFEKLKAKYKLFKKRSLVKPAVEQLLLHNFKKINIHTSPIQQVAVPSLQTRIQEAFMNILQKPYLVVNPNGEVIEIHGNWNDLVQIQSGVVSLQLSKLFNREIALFIKNTLLKTIKTKQPTASLLKTFNLSGKKVVLQVKCGPINTSEQTDELYLIILEQFELKKSPLNTAPKQESVHIVELEQELQLTKEYLQNYIEEIENHSAELQSLNEELQSLNEELQTANEELETSNEELQSTNEELQTAYAELQLLNRELRTKEQQLKETNHLFTTLFENLTHGCLLLDAHQRISLINTQTYQLLKRIGIQAPPQKINPHVETLLPAFVYAELASILIDMATYNMDSYTRVFEIKHQKDIYYYEMILKPIYSKLKQLQFIILNIFDRTELYQKEQVIYERNEMLNSLLQSNTSYLIRTDLEGRYTYANQAFCKKFGFDYNQLLGKSYIPTIHPEDIPLCQATVLQLLQNPNTVISVELRKPNPKGGFFYTLWEFVTIKDKQGNVQEIQCVGVDVTPYKLTLKALEEERNRLELIIWGGRLGTWEWDLQTNLIKFSQRWAEILEFEWEKVKEMHFNQWQELIHPEDKPKLLQALQEVIEDRATYYEVEHRKRTAYGQWKWINIAGKVVERDARGKALKIMGIHQDITPRKRAEEETKISETRNRLLLETMQESILVQDLTGKIISCNHRAEEILGLTHDQIIGQTADSPLWKVIDEHGKPLSIQDTPSMVTLRTGKPISNFILGIYRPNGKLVWVSVNSQLLYHPDTKIPYAVFATFHDITQSRQTEIELQIERRRLKDILKGTNVGTWEWNIPTGELILNERWAEMLGYTLKELEPVSIHTWQILCHSEDLKVMNNALREHFRNQNPYFVCEMRMRHKNGTWVWVVSQGKVHTWTEDQQPLFMSGTLQDITERKNNEQEILTAKQRLDIIASNYPQGTISLVDVQTLTFLYTGGEEYQKESSDPKYLIGKTIFEILPAELAEKIEQAIPRVLTKQTVKYELKFGNKTYLNILKPILNAEGIVESFVLVCNNITERKHLEENLRKLSLVARRTSNMVIITDKNKKILWVNESFKKISGYTLGEVIGKTPKMFQFEGTDQRVIAKVNEKLARAEPVRFEILNKGKHLEPYWLDIDIQPIFDSNNQLTGYIAVQTDITERKKNEGRILKQNEILKKIAFFHSHILRRPIANIIGLMYLMNEERKEPTQPNMPQYWELLSKAVNEVETIITQIVELSDEIE
ncbi:MAG: PAS domain S-box protein [Microscillaceae bacterium]|nr:PAS domain S-box protein [Microscillaceae bacterium]MDW8460311.1 PAS domain S-box protein [Cytophagales bacterium]